MCERERVIKLTDTFGLGVGVGVGACRRSTLEQTYCPIKKFSMPDVSFPVR